MQPVQLIRLPEVLERTALSKSTVYALAQAGDFPAWIKVSANVSAWVAHEVDAWIANRIATQRAKPGEFLA